MFVGRDMDEGAECNVGGGWPQRATGRLPHGREGHAHDLEADGDAWYTPQLPQFL